MTYIKSRQHPRTLRQPLLAGAATALAALALPVAAQTPAPTAGTLREVQVQSTTETEY